jgi:hypothetical protein
MTPRTEIRRHMQVPFFFMEHFFWMNSFFGETPCEQKSAVTCRFRGFVIRAAGLGGMGESVIGGGGRRGMGERV